MSNYLDFFSKKRMRSTVLQDPVILAALKNEGYVWIRRYNVRLENVLRDPTLGCIVEVMKMRDMGCERIESAAAKKLIYRLCYF
jgi:hypothetical protein